MGIRRIAVAARIAIEKLEKKKKAAIAIRKRVKIEIEVVARREAKTERVEAEIGKTRVRVPGRRSDIAVETATEVARRIKIKSEIRIERRRRAGASIRRKAKTRENVIRAVLRA